MTPVSTQGIVLKYWKYKENDCVVQIFTRALGKQSYLIHAPQSKRSKFRAAYLLPLSCLALEVTHSPKRDWGSITDARADRLHLSLSTDPVKASLSFFIADLIAATQLQGECDEALFDYLLETIDRLDQAEQGLADFHLRFLLDYTRLLGFDPQATFESDYGRSIPAGQRRLLMQGMAGQELSRTDRRDWMDLYLAYLRHELPFMGPLSSLDVLNGLL